MTLLAKVCGITRSSDAQAALEAGADLVGFVRHPASPRHCVNLEEASADVGQRGVLVSVADNIDSIIDEALACGLGWVQPYLPAAERADAYARVHSFDLKLLLPWPDSPDQDIINADLYLWETAPSQTGVHGGSGQNHAAQFPPPSSFLLAGGLEGDNVRARILALSHQHRIHCRGADSASRLETAPGLKSIPQIQHFTRAVHAIQL